MKRKLYLEKIFPINYTHFCQTEMSVNIDSNLYRWESQLKPMCALCVWRCVMWECPLIRATVRGPQRPGRPVPLDYWRGTEPKEASVAFSTYRVHGQLGNWLEHVRRSTPHGRVRDARGRSMETELFWDSTIVRKRQWSKSPSVFCSQ